MQRKYQRDVDAHKASRATLTKQVKQARPEMEEKAVWMRVSQDAGERHAWKMRRRRRKVVARVHERIHWRRENFTHQESRKILTLHGG